MLHARCNKGSGSAKWRLPASAGCIPLTLWFQAQRTALPSTHMVPSANLCLYPLLFSSTESLRCIWEKIFSVKFLIYFGGRQWRSGYFCPAFYPEVFSLPSCNGMPLPLQSHRHHFHFLSVSESKMWYYSGFRTPCIFGIWKGQSGGLFWPSFLPLFLYLAPK